MRYGPPLCSSAAAASPPTLGDLLLEASISKTLSRAGPTAAAAALHSLPSPLPEPTLLRLLRRPSLPFSAKLALFRRASPPSPAAAASLLRSLSRAGALDDDLLLSALRLVGPAALDSPSFKLLLDALLRAGRFDAAIQALDDVRSRVAGTTAEPFLSPQLYGSVIVALLNKSQTGPALCMFRKLLESPLPPPDPPTCNRLLAALRNSGMKNDFRDVFDEMSSRKFHFDTRGYNICIDAFGSWGQLGLALRLFREMKAKAPITAPDLCSYNSIIKALCLAGKIEDALAVYEELKGSGHEPDRFMYRTVIHECCKACRVDEAVRVFREMEYNNVRADTVVYNTLLDGMLKSRRLEDACQLFQRMVSDGVRASCYSYNILIDGLFRNGRPVAGFVLFSNLKKKGQFVDAVTYSIVATNMCKEGQVEQALDLLTEMEERGFVVDLVTITSILIGLHKNGNWDSADRLMKYVRDSSLLSNILRWKENVKASLRAPQDRGKDFTSLFPSVRNLNDVMSWISSQPQKDTSGADFDIRPKDEWSSSPYLDHLANKFESVDDSRMFAVRRGQRVQEKGVESFDMDMVNTYLSIFLAKGKLSIACKLFEIFTSLGREPVGYTYNSLMSAFVKKGYLNDAWGVLQEMGEKLCPADIATYNVIIQGLGKMGRADLASTVLDQLLKKGGHLDIVMYNTLLNALGKAGRTDEAKKLFKQMTESGINPDVVTFNTLIEVFAKAGKVEEAYKFLRKMLAAGCSPNNVTDTILAFLEKEIEKLRYRKASIMCEKESISDPLS